jgi:hypothetical protein
MFIKMLSKFSHYPQVEKCLAVFLNYPWDRRPKFMNRCQTLRFFQYFAKLETRMRTLVSTRKYSSNNIEKLTIIRTSFFAVPKFQEG